MGKKENDDLINAYTKSAYVFFSKVGVAGIASYVDKKSLDTLYQLLDILEGELEHEILRRIADDTEGDNQCANSYRNSGASGAVRIGNSIAEWVDVPLFDRYMVLIGSILMKNPSDKMIKDHLLDLLTKHRLTSRERLCACKGVLPIEIGETLASFIKKNCKNKKTRKGDSPYSKREIENDFNVNFNGKQSYDLPQLHIELRSTLFKSAENEKLPKLTINDFSLAIINPKKNVRKVVKKGAALYLFLLFDRHCTNPAEWINYQTFNKAVRKFEGVTDDFELGVSEKKIGNIKSVLLKKYSDLIDIEHNMVEWRLLLKNKRLKISIIPRPYVLHLRDILSSI